MILLCSKCLEKEGKVERQGGILISVVFTLKTANVQPESIAQIHTGTYTA